MYTQAWGGAALGQPVPICWCAWDAFCMHVAYLCDICNYLHRSLACVDVLFDDSENSCKLLWWRSERLLIFCNFKVTSICCIRCLHVRPWATIHLSSQLPVHNLIREKELDLSLHQKRCKKPRPPRPPCPLCWYMSDVCCMYFAKVDHAVGYVNLIFDYVVAMFD